MEKCPNCNGSKHIGGDIDLPILEAIKYYRCPICLGIGQINFEDKNIAIRIAEEAILQKQILGILCKKV